MKPARGGLLGLLYATPALLFVIALTIYPLGQLVYTSMTNKSLLGGGKFVGLANYNKAFGDATFWQALLFTLKYTLFITPILMAGGFVLALLTWQNTRLKQVTRGVVFLPWVIGLGTSSLLWYWLFDQRVGPINQVLIDLHIVSEPVAWFTNAELGLWAVIASVTWKVIGFGTILFVAAIQSIDSEVTEAAMIDGATYWQRVWRIILPLSTRSILLTTLISVVGSMVAFDQFYIMTAGGPKTDTFTSVYWMYQNSFIYFKLGYGSALAIILTVIIFAGAATQIALTRPKGTA